MNSDPNTHKNAIFFHSTTSTISSATKKKYKRLVTCREKKPSFSTVLTWVTILSSTQRTVVGTLLPHLSQTAVIPHLTAMIPVRLELEPITPGFASMIRCFSISNPSPSSTSDSAVNLLKKKADEVVLGAGVRRSCCSLLMRPLDNGDIPPR